MEDGGRGFALILMPGKVESLFGWDRPKIFVLRVIEKWSIYGVDTVGVESLGHLLGRTLRLAVVIVLSRKVVPLSQGLRRCGNDTKMRSWDDT